MSVSAITTSELQQLFAKEPGTKLLDVRTSGEFESVHVPSAVNFPLDGLDPPAIQKSLGVGADQTLYVICKMGGRSHKACEKFIAAGFSNVVNVKGGTDAWVSNGFPAEHGERSVMSLDRQVRIAAGSLVLIGALLAIFIHPAWAWLSAFIGAGLVFSGVTDTCGMGTVIAKMPWNQPKKKSPAAADCDTGG
jgi:rhodanese-related sulfurtransferase